MRAVRGPVSSERRLLFAFLGFALSASAGTERELCWVSRTLDPPIRLEGVRGIAESPGGMLWFSSWGGGLISYDGTRFRRYGIEDGLPTVYLRDCLFDSEGTLWIASGKGAIRMRGGGFETFDVESGLPFENIYSIAEDSEGRLHFGGEGGVLVFPREGGWTRLENPMGTGESAKVYALHFDSILEVVWQGWDDGRLVPIDPATLRPHEEIPTEDLSSARAVKSILRDAEGFLWVGCDYDVFRREPGGEWRSMRPGSAVDPYGGERLIPGREGEIFIATPSGVFLHHRDRWTHFDHLQIPRAAGVRTIHHDSNGCLWVGTKGKTTVLHRSPFRTILPVHPFEHRMTSTLVDRTGRLWIGGEALAYRENDEWIEVRRSEDGLVEHVTDLMETEDGRVLSLWANRGVLEWGEGEPRWLPPPPIEAQKLWTFHPRRSGGFYVGTERNGVILWEAGGWKLFREFHPEVVGTDIEFERVYSLLETREGGLLIGTEGALHRLAEGELRRVPGPMDDTEYKVAVLAQPPGGPPIAAITELGLFEIRGDDWVPIQTWQQGFQTNLITAVEPGPDGRLWVGTQADGLFFRLDGGWFQLGLSSGLIPCAIESVAPAPDGRVYFATDLQGAVEILPDRDPPTTRIERLSKRVVHGESVVLTVRGRDRFERTLSGDLRFTYRIDGGPWSPPTVEQPIFIPSVEAGVRTIEVAAVDLDGNRDPSPAKETFVVVHPLWRHPVTLILAAALLLNLALLIAFFVQRSRRLNRSLDERRERQLLLEEEVRRRTGDLEELYASREQLLTNFSHDFRTPLTNLIGYSRLLSTTAGENLSTDQVEFVEVIGNNAARLKRLVENAVQSLQTRDPLEQYPKTQLDLREVAFEAVRSHTLPGRDQGVELDLVCGEDPVEIEACDVLVARLLDNLISNAIKFSNRGGKVRVRIDEKEGQVRLSVEDEGIGIHSRDLPHIFDRFRQAHRGLRDHTGGLGIGLSICKEIADYHEAEIDVESSVEAGSVFTVTFRPFEKGVEETERGI